MRIARIAVTLITTVACGSDRAPVGPSSPTPPPVAVSLSGTVSGPAGPIAGAVIRFLDGPNAGRSTTTTAAGDYRVTDLTAGNANLSATAGGYLEARSGLTITGAATLHFQLEPAPLWVQRGHGASVFDMPPWIRRVQITATYTGRCENFVVRVGGRLVVNVIMGTCSVANAGARYEGTHLVTPGVVEVVYATGITWTVQEVR